MYCFVKTRPTVYLWRWEKGASPTLLSSFIVTQTLASLLFCWWFPYFSQIKLSKYVAVNMVNAHAHYEPDGTTYNLGNSFKLGCCYNIIKIHPNSKDEGWSEIHTRMNWGLLISTQRLKEAYLIDHSWQTEEAIKFSDYNLWSSILLVPW